MKSQNTLTLIVDGHFPAGATPDTIKVEPELGTFEIRKDDLVLANGQLASRGGDPT